MLISGGAIGVYVDVGTIITNLVNSAGATIAASIGSIQSAAFRRLKHKTQVFVFHEGGGERPAQVFKEIARLSKGAYCPFDAGSAKQLRELLSAVAVYAAGGRVASFLVRNAALQIVRYDAGNEAELPKAFAAMAAQNIRGLIVASDTTFLSKRRVVSVAAIIAKGKPEEMPSANAASGPGAIPIASVAAASRAARASASSRLGARQV